ncbi:sigma 54-interacting transcriptional regulator [Nitratidesulfovibrio liaohensis]|uniref:HTH-type transcriptional regulatory protein TyrR n=1 Tax=Nitratidesulfovibrio liaohensis TaxID=2604158 RepID=A0ABY9QZ26_9BACT|nr:sigma 54-interacting transcriptional regulator [Nitratidesulfovibrio liaohensis]WMW64444.1 sigma 54-interacting transcriptional regulator [Nitratidesulfovibrio liaohensis]
MKLRMECIFRDRVGIVSDLSSLLAGQALSIVSMEVERRPGGAAATLANAAPSGTSVASPSSISVPVPSPAMDRAFVYLEADSSRDVDRAALFETLGRIPDLLEFRIVDTLPAEERANRFLVLLDNLRDGVLSIDAEGRVTSINKVAREAYGCTGAPGVSGTSGDAPAADLSGLPLDALGLPDRGILDCLSGRELVDAKREVATPGGGRLQFFVTRRPIRDGEGRIIGAVEVARDMREIRKLARSITEPAQVTFGDIVGQHPAIGFAISFARRVAATDSIIAIRGESGTGKELFARAIHTASGRQGPFVPVNCAALPEQLLESELFGYEAGAFTGGRREGKPGLFETARGGTVLLDEIGDMPLASQAKMLRVMQEGSVRRVGGTAEVPVDVRIVTATNRTLERLVEEGRFRQDLYYRINVLPIHIPPLKERPEDIAVLAEHFLLGLAARLGGPVRSLSPGALARLAGHHWPGNVRELKNVVERAAILCPDEVVGARFILFAHELEGGLFGESARLADGVADTVADAAALASGHEHHGDGEGRLKDMIAVFEKRIIADAVAAAGSVRKAARKLGISHTALLDKLRRHGLKMV